MKQETKSTPSYKKRIYLDHAAYTTIAPEVAAVMNWYQGEQYGNPSSLYRSGRESFAALTEGRSMVASCVGAYTDEIFFTGSGTESDILAILGAARAYKQFGNHILISAIEHKAVLFAGECLSQEGFIVEYIPVDTDGIVRVDECLQRITEHTILISVMYVNNEIGTVQPIKELAKALQERRAQRSQPMQGSGVLFPLLHTDACQAMGYFPIDTRTLLVDLMSWNGTKIYGPSGVGVLYTRRGVVVVPLLGGGGQERGIRSGTENLPAIMGMAHALVRVTRRRDEEVTRLIALREHCISQIMCLIPDVVINGHRTKRAPNNIHISIPMIEGESVVLMLDARGIEVATGSACSSKNLEVSHVLKAIGQESTLMHGSIRITLGESTTKEDCDRFASTLHEVTVRLRSMSPLLMHI